MRITLFTIGTLGDTQPFVALAVRLRQDGHSVTLAARPDFAGLVAAYGVDFAPLGHPYQPFITGAAEASAIGSGHLLYQLRYGLSQRRYFFEQFPPFSPHFSPISQVGHGRSRPWASGLLRSTFKHSQQSDWPRRFVRR